MEHLRKNGQNNTGYDDMGLLAKCISTYTKRISGNYEKPVTKLKYFVTGCVATPVNINSKIIYPCSEYKYFGAIVLEERNTRLQDNKRRNAAQALNSI